jgi:1-acyl-sn-glycerol-3-phosphate acyltransferase
MGEPPAIDDQAWARSGPARVAREVIVSGILGPMSDVYTRRRVEGREHLGALTAPVVFVANHASHMDTPVLLRALPARWRRRTAVVAAADYFYERRLLANTVALAFCTVPLQREGGPLAGGPPPQLTALVSDGWSLVVYAEGTRSRDGTVGRLKAGAALLAAAYGMPIVPVHVGGTHEAMPTGSGWPTLAAGRWPGSRRPVTVRFGAPIRPAEGESHREVMERVRHFLADCGARTTPDPRFARRARGEG